MRKAPKRILKRSRDPLDGSLGMALFGLVDVEIEGKTTLLITKSVGEVRNLPPGYELNTCERCGSAVWANASFVEGCRRRKTKLRVECWKCAM